MWRNAEFQGFVERLRAYNQALPPERRVGLYGMDVQNLGAAIASVRAYLDRTDPAAAARARVQYRCFPREGRSEEAYGLAARRPKSTCEEQARTVLAEFVTRTVPTDPAAAEALFMAASAAANVVGAEAYIRAQYAGVLAWNVRDRAMAAAVESIARHGDRLTGRPGQVVAWAHNTHVGDARATDARYRGEINLGQVLREQAAPATLLVGFLTGGGTVIAAEEWDRPGRRLELRPPLPGSWAAALRALGRGDVVLTTTGAGPTTGVLERAVGVIYLPQQERRSHYFEADLTRQFDWVVYIDTSRAVTPLR
jgi:erythromycin esterase-like protein